MVKFTGGDGAKPANFLRCQLEVVVVAEPAIRLEGAAFASAFQCVEGGFPDLSDLPATRCVSVGGRAAGSDARHQPAA